MGRLIDISKIDDDRIERDNPVMYLTINGEYIEAVSLDYLNSLPTVEAIPKADYENRLKADMIAMLEELKYELYQSLCHEIHGKEDCPCTNQTTSCLATFRVCDANEAIYKVIQQKIEQLKGENSD